MVTASVEDLRREVRALGLSFWAGEAEVARNFLTAPHAPEDHVHWLRHQCYRELRGPGLLRRPHSHVRWIIDQMHGGLPAAETRRGREDFEYQLESLRQEFTHFRLFADILEDVTGEPVRMRDLEGLRLPSDSRIERMRERLIAEDERIAHIAYSFAEGGGAGIFHAGAALETADPLLLRIKRASRIVYDDEVGHGEHGAARVESVIETAAGLLTLRRMLVDVCAERLRMRSEMYGIDPDETRIAEIAPAGSTRSPRSDGSLHRQDGHRHRLRLRHRPGRSAAAGGGGGQRRRSVPERRGRRVHGRNDTRRGG